MTINAVAENNICTLEIEGRIDTLTAPQLEKAFNEYAGSCDKMIFDLSKVDYISSAGLRVIVVAHRGMEKKGGLVLRNLSLNVENIINMTGFNRSLHIEKT